VLLPLPLPCHLSLPLRVLAQTKDRRGDGMGMAPIENTHSIEHYRLDLPPNKDETEDDIELAICSDMCSLPMDGTGGLNDTQKGCSNPE
jgi:hypothetical protein